ncbi:hypothetical protein CHARACLAT_032590 [Characodon lateralis]|uniref:Uncharacterized protein n=1 Tax=Characodon lateralis TaxID=208331 RepID=A0ABU7DE83_9TELE|nr:hypothetical protein [Characodon lateralis]
MWRNAVNVTMASVPPSYKENVPAGGVTNRCLWLGGGGPGVMQLCLTSLDQTFLKVGRETVIYIHNSIWKLHNCSLSCFPFIAILKKVSQQLKPLLVLSIIKRGFKICLTH